MGDYIRAVSLDNHNMAASFARSLRLAEPAVCRQCSFQPTRRTFTSLQNPKREIRSRPVVQQSIAEQRLAGKPSFACSRGYKTVQEAKSRHKSGVCKIAQVGCSSQAQLD